METRKLKVSFNKSGSGSISSRISLPKIWIDSMGINQWNKTVSVSFDGEKITIEKYKYEEDSDSIVGKKWREISEEQKQELLKNANAVDGITGNNVKRDGECIIDLTEYYSVSGSIVDGEFIIEDDAVIYDCRG